MGAPFLSRNEARARLDLPAIEGGDDLITPLNVLTGGLASPRDTDPTETRYNEAKKILKKSEARKSRGKPTDEESEQLAAVYRSFFKRQAKTVLSRMGAKSAKWWDKERWDKELAEDLFVEAFGMSTAAAKETVKKLFDDGEYNAEKTEAFIRSMCQRRAEMVNQKTYDELVEALEADEDDDGLKATPEGVFENAEENRSESAGWAFAGALIAWSALEACRQNEKPGQNVYKTWVCTSGNPRASHARMNGETVQYDEPFSNGAMWPGDIDNLDVEEVANCQCVLVVEVRD